MAGMVPLCHSAVEIPLVIELFHPGREFFRVAGEDDPLAVHGVPF